MRKKGRKPTPKSPDDLWFVYLLRCAEGTLYTGIAKDVNRRFQQHNAGTASRYTRCRLASHSGLPGGPSQPKLCLEA
jgi:GIY-YIG catalytic domain